MEPAAQFGYWCSSDLLLKLINSVGAFKKAQTAMDPRSVPVSSLPSSEPKHLDILSDIIGLSRFEEALVMPCSKHGDSLGVKFLECVFKSCERIKRGIVEGSR